MKFFSVCKDSKLAQKIQAVSGIYSSIKLTNRENYFCSLTRVLTIAHDR